ncbi:hypothetical protein [Kitasatospora brasiliensis]|uniref:hypothetical protein n=1 Tax=Kitasatospora brasiliensis TaxID=3058040 RepID=UPI00292D27E5|nr:hypothetical protein [Kitasatospora sp. K002]
MRTRIAAVAMVAAGITGLVAAPAVAATATSGTDTAVCATVLNQPCVSHQIDGQGIVGIAQVSADPGQLTMVRVEIRSQAAWGSPWETVTSATTVQFGSAKATTARVAVSGPRMICATAGPAMDVSKQTTTCTNPF